MNASDLPDETLFETALKCRSAAERADYLDQACAGQPELRRRLEVLLEAHDRSGQFLEQPAATDRPTIKLDLAPEEQPGTMIGRYKLLQRIGEGGMGVVYMAEQTEPVVRKVALKIIKLGMDTKQVVARFEAERQALALMDHPNIAKVLDAGTTGTSVVAAGILPAVEPGLQPGGKGDGSFGSLGQSEAVVSASASPGGRMPPSTAGRMPAATLSAGRPYFVMELVHGVPITEYCDKNKLTTKERLELFIPVCQAIQHAHQKGIIHRDIKPSNVMVTLHDGVPVPKVIDFGVAKATNQRLTEKTLFTHYAQMIGTPAYMSPEQAEMSGLDIDTRSDIYSLGVLLYELLTGTTPFDAKELLSKGYAEMQRIIVEQEPAKPSTRMSTLTVEQRTVVASHRNTEASTLRKVFQGDLDWIVMKCLEKDRARRYETSNGLAADLRRHLSNELITARPPTTGYLLKKLIKRNKVAFSAAAVVLAGVLVALEAFVYATIHVTRERNAKDLALQERSVAMELATTREAEAKAQLFVALRNQARTSRYSRRAGQRLDSLAALAQAARIRNDDSLREDAIAALALPDLRPGPSSERWVPETQGYAFDGNYQRYVRLEKDGTIRVHSVADDREVQRFVSSPGMMQQQLKLSPDSAFVAKVETNGQFRVWRVSDGQPALRQPPTNCLEMTFSRNSRQCAVGQGPRIRRFDLETGEELSGWTAATNVHRLAFDPRDRRLAVGYQASEIVSIFNVGVGETKPAAELRVGPLRRQILAWDPTGEHLAVAGHLPQIQIWNVSAHFQIARLIGHVQDVTDLSFHPEGGLLASHSWDGTLRLWEPWSGRELLQTPTRALVRFSDDGKWAGVGWTGENKYHLWEITPSVEYRTFDTLLAVDLVGVY
jgi:serine/threonine protein kinase